MSARPVEDGDDPFRLVSAADCRLMAFETVNEATRLWIKGRDFTVARLLGDNYKGEAENYNGGALAIFRLAPQDYHRFHSPVDGKIGPMTYISGEYYTVNVCSVFTFLNLSDADLNAGYISRKPFVLPWMCMARTYAKLYLLIVLNSEGLWLYVSVL
jgi:phosphatidylserine decarboxylase precursor